MVQVNLHAASCKDLVGSFIEHMVALATHQPDQKVNNLPRSTSEEVLNICVVIDWVKEHEPYIFGVSWEVYSI